MFVQDRDDMCGLDSAILMNPRIWEASGHVGGFNDPLVECKKCKRRFRVDHVGDKCPECGGEFGEVRQFNMMFKTQIGANEDASSVSYLRPETAGGIFVNFKNVIDSFHPKLPFGIAQIGKAFRNEIAPRDFVFRSREFEQMEIEYFVNPSAWESSFEEWRRAVHTWTDAIGLAESSVHELEVGDGDRAHSEQAHDRLRIRFSVWTQRALRARISRRLRPLRPTPKVPARNFRSSPTIKRERKWCRMSSSRLSVLTARSSRFLRTHIPKTR